MKTLLRLLALAALLGATFLGGYIARGVRTGTGGATPAARRVLYYVDPMHPEYRSDAPGVAPDCGMPLEPVYAGDPPAGRGTATGGAPETTIRISAERQQAIGVAFSPVVSGAGTRTIRAVGRVAPDETRIGHVHTRIDGWIERVLVDFTGDVVKQGEPMLTIYSPEMLASQQELLLAARAREVMKGNPLAPAGHGESLFEAAKRRLQLWDLGDEQIAQVLRTGQPIASVTVAAPMSGVVTERKAFPNQRVTPDSDLYTITDLTHVWILADVFESDAAARRPRQLHPAPGRSGNADAAGPARRAEPGHAHETRHVRERRVRRRHRSAAHRPGGGRPRQRRAADGLRRSRQRLPRAA
jgi:membrane fusion protein, copper/silver efflux system